MYVFTLSFQANSEEEQEEEGFDPGKELFSVHASEKLTNSIRLQWRRLKSHVEQLDSQGISSVFEFDNSIIKKQS